MSKENIPPYFVLDKSKEVIFYLGKGEIEKGKKLQTWMKDFPSDFQGMIINSACLFKKLKQSSRE